MYEGQKILTKVNLNDQIIQFKRDQNAIFKDVFDLRS